MDTKYSVLMPLYKNDNPEWLKLAIDSMLNQTIPPNEFVIVVDGPIPDTLKNIVEVYKSQNKELFNIHYFEQNRGLGVTLADGVKLCSNELIARMDADDFSVPERCEKQVKAFKEHPDLDVIGSNVDEFVGDISNVVARVRLPQTNEEMKTFAKRRCPVRHPTLMYKKSKVLKSGNYRDYRHAQDYNLIVHMFLAGCKMQNIQEVLVYMRVSENFYERRGGWNQAKLILRLKKEFLDSGFYSLPDFIISGMGNMAVCLLPNKVRKVFYMKVLRK
jgi:glycosyltransferase involved in cell wall biosynthesis